MRTFRRSALVLSLVAFFGAALTGAAPGSQLARSGWFTSWAQSQQSQAGRTLDHQSVRVVTHLSQGGDAVRVRIQNTFGTSPLTVDATTVGQSSGGSAVTAPRPVTFAGKRSVTVQPGGEVWSDAADLRTEAGQDVGVSMYVAGKAVPGQHNTGLRDHYLTATGAGNHTGDTDGNAYAQKVSETYLVSAVDVHNTALRGTIAAFGSSVVDGNGSTYGANVRWTDDLARRITAELPAGQRMTVANAGIGGTTSAPDCPGMPSGVKGLDAASRLDRDVLGLHGVTGVVYYYGTNDLAYGCSADQILTSYRTVFARLRQAGVKVFVTPITPRPGYSDQNNLDRYAVGTFVKQWESCAGTCTGVTDFDQVLKDPLRPNGLQPRYDSGDGVHANSTGQQAIAGYLSLPQLLSSTR
ncbi:GDSL-type esterase/lipase family protein [Amycolatopsis jejuensis]|uniref:GDSL-type esterase/lipase family protein n=1 Tax=Amycolatopsis jejuensis TaxID=330084 RepID=UPI000524D84F|nr:GDSL-type esterase/lipase family protein [Amycolatopsis jejuensis]